MRIITAWRDGEWGYCLISAYDDATATIAGEVPDLHVDAVSAARRQDEGEVREMIIEIPDAALDQLFNAPIVSGSIALSAP